MGLAALIGANTFGATGRNSLIAPSVPVEPFNLAASFRALAAPRDTSPIYIPRLLVTPRRGQVLKMRYERKKHAASLLGTGLNRAARRADARRLCFA